jgi:general secretion pathway protein J
VRARRSGGFTLIEVLLAVGIFAIVGLAASQMLGQMLQAEASTRQRAERLHALQRAVSIVERDLMQVVDRPVRDELGDPLPALRGGLDDVIAEFTRRGWRNPTQLPRAELQRVAYLLEEDRLVRLYWNVLDRAEDSAPVRQVLLDAVESASIEFIAGADDASAFWPPQSGGGDAGLPAAVRVRLAAQGFGEVERLVLLPGTLPAHAANPAPAGGAGGPGGGQPAPGGEAAPLPDAPVPDQLPDEPPPDAPPAADPLPDEQPPDQPPPDQPPPDEPPADPGADGDGDA